MTEPNLHKEHQTVPKNHWLIRFRMITSIDDLRALRFWKAVAAEFVGTLLLVLIGCGSVVRWDTDGKVVQIALSFGLSVGTLVWCLSHVSGGHINPAVTFAFFVTRHISLARALCYFVAQIIGAIVGAGILKGLTPANRRGELGATIPHDDVDGGKAFGVEFFITFVLVLTVFATVDKKRKDLNGSSPLTIGLSVTMCHLFAVQYTGSSMNTARSFGPAVVMGIWKSHWVYWIGPILGGVTAGVIYENTFAVNASLVKARAFLLASEYDCESYPPKKTKIKIIEEEAGESSQPLNAIEKNPETT